MKNSLNLPKTKTNQLTEAPDTCNPQHFNKHAYAVMLTNYQKLTCQMRVLALEQHIEVQS